MLITPEIWKLKAILAKDDDRYGLGGIHFDGEYAVATDGYCLVAIKCKEPKLEAYHLIRPIWPDQLPGSIEVPDVIGLHGVRVLNVGRPVLVEIIDGKSPFPPWRKVLPKQEKPFQRLNAQLLLKVIEAAGLTWTKDIDIAVGPDLELVTLATGREGAIAAIMPCRVD